MHRYIIYVICIYVYIIIIYAFHNKLILFTYVGTTLNIIVRYIIIEFGVWLSSDPIA